ncbi:MAG: YihY/virulence factor BrkB family protein [Xanthomonadaceae bacterium]|nr:YihY/virulence factor BrkB family protein [Xanthomonadaceae bacterium]
MALVKRVWQSIGEDRLTLVAAGVAFYLFLALFPALFAAVSIYGLVADPMIVEGQLARLSDLMPQSALDVIGAQLADITGEHQSGLGWGAAIAIVIAIASAGKGAKAMMKGLNIAYNRREERSFFKAQAVALLFTVSVMVFLAISLALIAIVPPLIVQLPLGVAAVIAAEVGKWVLLFVLILLALAVTYRYAPCIRPPRWYWVAPGSITAAVLWVIASGLFSWFAANFGRFNETYGILAGGVVVLLWLQISAFVVLLGAEVNEEWERLASVGANL